MFILKVLDIRTFRVVRKLPELENKRLVFSNNSDVMFGFSLETRFQVHDSRDYSLITEVETAGYVQDLKPSWDDFSLAVVESEWMSRENHLVKIYDVGQEKL